MRVRVLDLDGAVTSQDRLLDKFLPDVHDLRRWGPVLRDGLIFGVSQQGRNFFCLDAKTGEKKWNDDTDHGECGSILNVGSVMVALTSDKDLIVFRPGAKEFSEVARYRVSSSPTWCVPILTGNRIYVKDKAGSLTLWTVD